MTPDHPAPAESAAEGPSTKATVLVSLAIGLVVALAVVAATYWLSPSPTNADQGGGIGPVSGTESRPLPEQTLDSLDSEDSVVLAAYRGQPLVVNFWATWCEPCREEMPDFEAFAQAGRTQVSVLGVNVQDNLEAARRFAAELGITYDLAADPTGALYAEVRGFGMPTTLLVTAEGRVVYRHTGALDLPGLTRLVSEHLGVIVEMRSQ